MAVAGFDILNKRQFLSVVDTNTRKAISGTVAQLGPMTAGALYYLTTDADCFFLQGPTGMTAPSSSTGNPLWAKERVEILATVGNEYVDVITSGGSGTAWLTRQD